MLKASGTDPVELSQALIRCPSVTPAEAGALHLLEEVLGRAGFSCHRLVFSQPGTPDVDNLFARIGTEGPHLCFAGHTDVVPPGSESAWSHPPFSAEIENEVLYGRGAVDMKGNIACFAAAALSWLSRKKANGPGAGLLPGSISFLITGDEEGPAINGTKRVLDWMAENGHVPDACVVGEPSNPAAIGDAIKIGRRGSMNGRLTISGRQGHAAYPHLAKNPIPGLLNVLQDLLASPLDFGTDHFSASNLEVTSIDVGNPTVNVIPASAQAAFNIRFNDLHTAAALDDRLRGQIRRALVGSGLAFELETSSNSDAFLTAPGPLVDTMVQAITTETGRTPELSTSGGTSDARFIKNFCPVIEFGLVNATIHAVDECVPLTDLELLTRIYRTFIERYFAASTA